jgi:periplasmic protein TonB
MRSWFDARKESENTADETRIRVCLVSRDPALVEEVHKDLLIGFSTRSGYEFDSEHPDFQQYCDVLFVDLRPAGVQGDPKAGLAFIDSIRKSVSHPPIVVVCEADASDLGREVMQRGAYEKLTAPLNMPQLRLALQRAYEFRLAETKLETFLTEASAAHEQPQNAPKPKARAASRKAATAERRVRPTLTRYEPSRLAVGFVLGCVLFFAGLVGVRAILTGMGDALASAGLAPDYSGSAPADNIAAGAHPSFAPTHVWPLSTATNLNPGALGSNSVRRGYRAEAELAAPAVAHSSLPGYEPAAIIERVTPRYSPEARSQHLEGTVRIRAVIGKDGVPRGLARASGDPLLAQIAMDAVSLWRYAPATIDGEPVESEVIIPIEFRLPE